MVVPSPGQRHFIFRTKRNVASVTGKGLCVRPSPTDGIAGIRPAQAFQSKQEATTGCENLRMQAP
ncbi:hypothetical protein A8146_08945 [Mesorhizobium loti]|nr:hypothetical protein A8146_08945 [Mesorhizobium loti]